MGATLNAAAPLPHLALLGGATAPCPPVAMALDMPIKYVFHKTLEVLNKQSTSCALYHNLSLRIKISLPHELK